MFREFCALRELHGWCCCDSGLYCRETVVVGGVWALTVKENPRRCPVGSEVAHNTELLEDLTNIKRKKKTSSRTEMYSTEHFQLSTF